MSALLAQARLRACRYWPFASHAILSMVPVPRPGLGTLACDAQWRVYFDDAALARMDTDHAAGLILHELDHLLKRHHKRAKGLAADDAAQWKTWNHATDASINSDLRAQDIPLPPGLIYPEKFKLPVGLSAEEYYRAISDQAAADRESQADDEDQDDPQDSGESQSQADGDEADDDTGGQPDDSCPADDTGDESDQSSPDSDGPPEQEPTGCEAGQDQDSTDSPAAEDGPDGQKHADGQEGPGGQGNGSDASGAQDVSASPGDTGQEPGDGDGQGQAQDLVDENGGWQGEPLTHGQGGSCSDGRQRPWELGAPDDDNPGLDEADQEQLIHVAAKNALEGAGESEHDNRWGCGRDNRGDGWALTGSGSTGASSLLFWR